MWLLKRVALINMYEELHRNALIKVLFKKITYWVFFSKLIAVLFEYLIFITKFILTITFVRQASHTSYTRNWNRNHKWFAQSPTVASEPKALDSSFKSSSQIQILTTSQPFSLKQCIRHLQSHYHPHFIQKIKSTNKYFLCLKQWSEISTLNFFLTCEEWKHLWWSNW